MEIEDGEDDPERLAAAIHAQLQLEKGPIPVKEIARALDIIEIKEKKLTNFEGALVTTRERDAGSIVVNAPPRNPGRRRFTIAHELGHFLCAWHKPTSEFGFTCAREDMTSDLVSPDQHQTQEREANRFAIELLAPRSWIAAFLEREPTLEWPLAMAKRLAISREASFRRYVELHLEPIAIVTSHEGLVRHVDSAAGFPELRLKVGDILPTSPAGEAWELPAMAGVEPASWVTHQIDRLRSHTVRQGSWARTLLHAAQIAEEAQGNLFG